MGLDCVDWFYVSQDNNRSRSVVNMVTDLDSLKKKANSCETLATFREELLREIIYPMLII